MANKTVNDLAQWAIKNVLPVPGSDTGLLKSVARLALKYLVQESVRSTSLPDKVNEVFVKIETDGVQKIVENILSLLEQQLQNIDLNNLTDTTDKELLIETK